jgi:hypothetical protein
VGPDLSDVRLFRVVGESYFQAGGRKEVFVARFEES